MDPHFNALNQIKGKVLFIETMASGFIMSGADLAIQLKEKGHDVYYCYISSDGASKDFDYSLIKKILGCSVDKHVKNLLVTLNKKGIKVIHPPELNQEVALMCKNYSVMAPTEDKLMRNYRYKNVPLGLSVSSLLISLHKNTLLDFRKYKKIIKKKLEGSAIIYEKSLILLSSIKPNYCILFNGRTPNSYPVEKAIEASTSIPLWREVSSDGKLIHLYQQKIHNPRNIANFIMNIGKNISNEMLDDYSKKYYLERNINNEEKKIIQQIKEGYTGNFDSSKKIYLFLHSSEDELYAIEDNSDYFIKTQIEAIRSIDDYFKDMTSDCEYIVRIHPHIEKKASQERLFWNNLQLKYGKVIPSYSPIDTLSLMAKSFCVFTYGSTLTCRANYLQIPVILFDPSSPFFYMNIAVIPRNHAELIDYLNKLPNIPLYDSLPSKVWAYLYLEENKMGIPFKYFRYDNYSNKWVYNESGFTFTTYTLAFAILRNIFKHFKSK